MTDRIIKINEIDLVINLDLVKDRRNIICYSKILEEYLKTPTIDVMNLKTGKIDIMKLTRFVERANLTDIEIIGVDGFY